MKAAYEAVERIANLINPVKDAFTSESPKTSKLPLQAKEGAQDAAPADTDGRGTLSLGRREWLG